MEFDEKMSVYRDMVEGYLDEALEKTEDDETVLEAMRYGVLGGKRVRALLAMLTCEMLCGDAKKALPAAAAIEMVHGYSLVHDDLPAMDDDDLRRGKPSTHIAFGEATAILAGDALLTHAFYMLTLIDNPAVAVAAVRELSLSAGYRGMVRGQELDLLAETRQALTIEEIDEIHSYKTAKLFTAAAVMGGYCGGANEEDITAIRAYTENLGLAFQIVDDVLDVVSNTEQLGKPVGSDAGQSKKTYASIYGVDASRKMVEQLTSKAKKAIAARFGEKANVLGMLADELSIRKM